jgi:hypothetical protein
MPDSEGNVDYCYLLRKCKGFWILTNQEKNLWLCGEKSISVDPIEASMFYSQSVFLIFSSFLLLFYTQKLSDEGCHLLYLKQLAEL